MRKIKLIVIVLFFICTAFAGVAKADAYLRGFEALEQKDYKTALYFLSLFAALQQPFRDELHRVRCRSPTQNAVKLYLVVEYLVLW